MGNKYLVTGNEFVSLPTIREEDAAIEGISFLHMGSKGMLEICGNKGKPLLKPFLEVDGVIRPFQNISWKRTHYWIPVFQAQSGDIHVEGTLLAPVGERGFGINLEITNKGEAASIRFGLIGYWAETKHSINESKTIEAVKNVYTSGWNHCFVMDFRPDISLFALAPIYTEKPEDCKVQSRYEKIGSDVSFEIQCASKMASAEICSECFWFGIGFEEVAAATSAKEMLRHGFENELHKTCRWLEIRQKTTGDGKLDEYMNVNMFFSFFFGSGITMDTEELVLVTSRSPRYYVSAAYWDRDSLLWSFPAVLMADPDTAREMLLYVFTRQIRNVGIHSRYIDGTVLEPGFELDELCAPVIALQRYIDCTKDREILGMPEIQRGLHRILHLLSGRRHSEIALYETFLQPTDDMHVHPYLTYDNVLVWYSLKSLSRLCRDIWPEDQLDVMEKESQSVRRAILQHCIKERDGAGLFAWSVDLKGRWDIYDEPPGSLLLLPHYGFCSMDDPVWMRTMQIIRSEDYAYSFAGCPVAEIGCAHAPHPWVLSIANSFLCGHKEQARKHLMHCSMDNGIACESVDEYTGESRTGAAFATCAGFLAYAVYTAFGKENEEKEI